MSLGPGPISPICENAGPRTKTIWPEMALFSDGKQGRSWPNGFRAGQKSQTYGRYSMQTQVFQIALSEGLPNIPHIPPPTGHSAGTNQATMAPALENAPCWHNCR